MFFVKIAGHPLSIHLRPLLPSILVPSQICFSTPRFTSRRSFSHDFSLQRHTLFGMKLCIASSIPVIWPCFVPRHTFFPAKVCIAIRGGMFTYKDASLRSA